MTANRSTRAAGLQSGDAPIAAQSIHFDARDRLSGDLDGTTVAQAVEETGFEGKTVGVNGSNHPLQNTETSDGAEVGR